MEVRSLRLFFGLPLPADLREQLDQWQRTYLGIEGWTRAEGLHLTLAFLGQRRAEALSGLEGIAAAVAARHETFPLHTVSLCSFSHGKTTRLLWLGLAPAPALVALAKDLRESLRMAKESIDTKPFHPHVTLARFRQPQRITSFDAPPAEPFDVTGLTLFESSPQGHYATVQSWPLRRV